ncbi:hypothetical protein BW897_24845 [Bacillus cereus]|uniref:Uncharacterized protein n=1 Tax=Bacillus cereus TaxID=1396 RepID=A0A1S9TJ97_BACCE|nr:hypothetical protein [Bacillus mycoides]OOR09992.1 hypothetical protein BW897_24845 [Bacillus cereus]
MLRKINKKKYADHKIVIIGKLVMVIQRSKYVIKGTFSIILFLSAQRLETYMSQMVLSGEIPAGKASNML